jgi:hypothetical protein
VTEWYGPAHVVRKCRAPGRLGVFFIADLRAQTRTVLLRLVLDQSDDIADLACRIERAIRIASRLNESRIVAWSIAMDVGGRGRLEGVKRPLIAQYAGQTGGTNLHDLRPR